jgi:hypothetical protein
MVRIPRFLPAMVSLALLAACAGPNNLGSSGMSPTATVNERVASKRSGGPTVYATSYAASGQVVDVFADGGASFLRKIALGGNVVADSSGYLYIAHDREFGHASIYADAGTTLVQQVAIKDGPWNGVIAADGLGHFYVLGSHKKGPLYLYEYQIGTTAPIREFNVTGSFAAITTDGSGNLYLALAAKTVNVYAPGSTSPERTITKGLDGPQALTVDPQGNLYVANNNFRKSYRPPYITVYPPGAKSPSLKITTGLTDPVVLHTDSSGNLGVLNGPNSYNSKPHQPNVTIYAQGSRSPLNVISQGIDMPTSFVFDSSNNVYVSNQGATDSDLGSVTVYAAGSYSLTRTITKNLTHPNSVAVGP